jgi:hypothetical protein
MTFDSYFLIENMNKKDYPYQNRSLKNIKGEHWEDIPGLDGAYCISNFGRVKSLRRWIQRELSGGFWLREKILAQRKQIQLVSDGKRKLYRLTAQISYSGKKYSIYIARTVYFLFVKQFDLQDRSLVASYKDGDPFNICPQNLILTTLSVSITKSYKNKHRKRESFGNKAQPITQYDLTGKKIQTFNSASEASRITNINSTSICSALTRKDSYGAGYIWRKGTPKNTFTPVAKSVQSMLDSKKLHNSIITQYDLKGKKIAQYTSIRSAAIAVKTGSNRIRLALLGKAFTVKGYYWKLDKGPARIDIKPILEKKFEKLRKGICRPVIQYDLMGNEIKTYYCVAEAARAISVHDMSIHLALKPGKIRTCKGFIWRYSKH